MVPAPGFLRGGNEVTSAQGQTTAATLSSGLCARLTGKAQARLSVPLFQDSRQCRNTSSLRALDATGRDGSHLRGFPYGETLSVQQSAGGNPAFAWITGTLPQ